MRMEDRVSSPVNSSNSLKKSNNNDRRVDNNMDTRTKNQLERSNQDSESHPLQDKIQKAGSQDKPRVNSSDPLEKIPKLGHHSRDHRQELNRSSVHWGRTHKPGLLKHPNRRLRINDLFWGKIHKHGLLSLSFSVLCWAPIQRPGPLSPWPSDQD